MPEPAKDQPDSVVSFGPYRLDVGTGQLWRGKREVKVTPKAFTALRYFLDHPVQLVTKDDLFAAVWPQTIVTEATLASCIQELRAALRDDARAPRYIETVHRRGFRFIGEVVSSQEEEETQKAKGKTQKAKIGQTEQETETNEYVDAGPRTPDAGLLSRDVDSQTSIPVPLAPLLPPPRLWSRASFVLLSLVLLVSIIIVVQYLSRSALSPHPSVLVPEEVKPRLSLPDKPSIIILPFTNLSGDPGQEYFSDGITEVLTSTLSRLSSLFVIARTSAFTYKGKGAKVQDISREMGVRYVLEGSVFKADDHLRIMAQLIDATTGYSLWSERYDRPLKDIFVVQEEIVQKIVTTLKLQITLQEQGYLIRKTTDNPEAYDAYLRGMEFLLRPTRESNAQARQMGERAIALDPTYAAAYTLLGTTYLYERFFRWSMAPQTLETAVELAQKAIALDDSQPQAHSVLGRIYLHKKQYEQALVEGERALALNPNDADSHMYRGEVLTYAGRPQEGVLMAEKAMRLNPHPPVWYFDFLGWRYYWVERYEEAVAVFKRALDRSPHSLIARLGLTASYGALGRETEARTEAAEFLRRTPDFALAAHKQTVPIRDPIVLERHLNNLRKAGLK